MKSKVYISRQFVHLLFGIFLGTFVLLQAVYVPPVSVDQQEQQDKKDAESEEKATVSQSQAVPNSSSQINLGFDSYLLEEVSHNEEDEDKMARSQPTIPGVRKAVRVLLRKIISPNAP